MNFENKVVIVTGGSSGIGAAAAECFANLSAKVVLVGRNESRLKDVAKTVEKCKGIKPLAIKADMTNDAEVKKIIDDTIKIFGKIDVLVNNAGAGAYSDLKDGIGPFDKMIALNLRSVFLITSLAVPHLVKTKGNVINISSIVAIKPFATFSSYCIAKAGLDMLTKCTAKELAGQGIRVNSVNPGPVVTGFQASMGLNGEALDNFEKNWSKMSPLGYLTTSKNCADLILFLASDQAVSITGSIFVIDNGTLIS